MKDILPPFEKCNVREKRKKWERKMKERERKIGKN